MVSLKHDKQEVLGKIAAGMIFEAMRPACEFVEVIKIRFTDRGKRIEGGVVIVDPVTHQKERLESAEDIGSSDIQTAAALTKKLKEHIRNQIHLFIEERKERLAAAKPFDTLFR